MEPSRPRIYEAWGQKDWSPASIRSSVTYLWKGASLSTTIHANAATAANANVTWTQTWSNGAWTWTTSTQS